MDYNRTFDQVYPIELRVYTRFFAHIYPRIIEETIASTQENSRERETNRSRFDVPVYRRCTRDHQRERTTSPICPPGEVRQSDGCRKV